MYRDKPYGALLERRGVRYFKARMSVCASVLHYFCMHPLKSRRFTTFYTYFSAATDSHATIEMSYDTLWRTFGMMIFSLHFSLYAVVEWHRTCVVSIQSRLL